MTKLQAIKKQYQRALERFEDSLSQEETDFTRDSAILRFEFCFDLAWKLIKEILSEEKGVLCASPKDCWRQAYKVGLVEYDDLWLRITDWRNEAVHTYNEEFAKELYKKLPESLKCFCDLRKLV